MTTSRLDRGALCLTTQCAALNSGLQVIVLGYVHFAVCRGPSGLEHWPYRVRRLDGLPFPLVKGGHRDRFLQTQARPDQLLPVPVPAGLVLDPSAIGWGGLLA